MALKASEMTSAYVGHAMPCQAIQPPPIQLPFMEEPIDGFTLAMTLGESLQTWKVVDLGHPLEIALEVHPFLGVSKVWIYDSP